ncbi:hypothetical protein C8R45DRAFT_1189425 [Mycena sanguinolenta]|nr:hypothetical protein C8R45DRAFT_1189425 [Mycena sanguinolenta]
MDWESKQNRKESMRTRGRIHLVIRAVVGVPISLAVAQAQSQTQNDKRDADEQGVARCLARVRLGLGVLVWSLTERKADRMLIQIISRNPAEREKSRKDQAQRRRRMQWSIMATPPSPRSSPLSRAPQPSHSSASSSSSVECEQGRTPRMLPMLDSLHIARTNHSPRKTSRKWRHTLTLDYEDYSATWYLDERTNDRDDEERDERGRVKADADRRTRERRAAGKTKTRTSAGELAVLLVAATRDALPLLARPHGLHPIKSKHKPPPPPPALSYPYPAEGRRRRRARAAIQPSSISARASTANLALFGTGANTTASASSGRAAYGLISPARDTVLGLPDVARLVAVLCAELERTGVSTLFVFSSLALDVRRTGVSRLIRAFVATCSSTSNNGYRNGAGSDRFPDEARLAAAHELGMCLH